MKNKEFLIQNSKFRILNLLALFFVSQFHLQAQLFQLGPSQNPPSVHWKTIITPHFEIIFPEEIANEAKKIADQMEFLYAPVSKTLKGKPGRIPLVLQTQNIESNGFVTLAPRRSEWFNTPPQTNFVGTNTWYHLLGIHEYRHVVQFDRINQNWMKVVNVFFGETGVLIGSFLTVPYWYWEGDAVATETRLTESGRGRLPSFLMPIRGMILEGADKNYYQMYFGSYKKYFGNIYDLGYVMASHVNRERGEESWREIVSQSTSFPNILTFSYSFSWAMRQKTGFGAPVAFNGAKKFLDSAWQSEIPKSITSAETIYKNDNGFMTPLEGNPQEASDGSVVFLDYNLGERPGLKAVDRYGKIRFLNGQNYPGYFSVAGKTVVWADIEPDPRWGYRQTGVIYSHDLTSGKTGKLTHNSRFTYAAISPDEKTIAAVEYSTSNICQMVLLQAGTGVEINRFSNPDNDYLITPSWSSDNHQIVFVALNEAGRALKICEGSTGNIQTILPYSKAMTIHKPVFWREYILYNAYENGIDNIYAVKKTTGEKFQVTSRKLGAFNASVSLNGESILFDDYQNSGYTIARMKLNDTTWKRVEDAPVYRVTESLLPKAEPVNFDSIPKSEHEVKNYPTLRKLINIHSWYGSANSQQVSVGLFSRNILNTLQASLGYTYDRKENTSGVDARFSYGRLYPILDIGGHYGIRSSTYIKPADEPDKPDKIKIYTWNEQSLEAGFRLPLNFTRPSGETYVQIGAKSRFVHVTDQTVKFLYEQNSGWFKSMNYSGLFFHGVRAPNYIYPYFGQLGSISYEHMPFRGDDYEGYLFVGQGAVYVPGILKRNSFYIDGSYERQKAGANYRFVSPTIFPRGYKFEYHDRILRVGANYTVPLLYPDLNILDFIYIKRIYTTGFYDYGLAKDFDTFQSKKFRSAGDDLIFNAYFFSLPIEVGIGIRYAYRFDAGNNKKRAELLLTAGGNF